VQFCPSVLLYFLQPFPILIPEICCRSVATVLLDDDELVLGLLHDFHRQTHLFSSSSMAHAPHAQISRARCIAPNPRTLCLQQHAAVCRLTRPAGRRKSAQSFRSQSRCVMVMWLLQCHMQQVVQLALHHQEILKILFFNFFNFFNFF